MCFFAFCLRFAVAFAVTFGALRAKGEKPTVGSEVDGCTAGDGSDGVCHSTAWESEVDGEVPGILANVALEAGCGDDTLKSSEPRVGPFPGESEQPLSRRARQMLECLFTQWYQSDGYGNRYGAEMGQEGTYGEITPQGTAALFSFVGKLAGPLSVDDAFFDLGSGVGKMVLQAYLTTGAGSTMGIELDAARHRDAAAALQRFQEGVHAEPPLGRHMSFTHDDIRNTELWSNATVVYAASLCFPLWLMVEFSWLLTATLRPGAVLLSLKALPGCHPGLRLLGTVSADMSWAQLSEVHVYVVPPMDVRPPLWLSVTEAQWQEFVQREADKMFSQDEGAVSVGVYGRLCAQSWAGIPALVASRAVASATIEFDDRGVARNTLGGLLPPAEATARQVAAASMHLVWGDGNSMVRCACRELEAVIMAEADASSKPLRRWFVGNLSDINRSDSAGETLLHSVARTRQRKAAPNVIRALAAEGAELHARDHLGRTPLHFVADRGHAEIARALLEERADPNQEDDSQASPVAFAAKWGYVKVLELLFKFGGDASRHGAPLRFAIERQMDQVVPMLLDNGAEVNAQDVFGRTPLGTAAQKGSGLIVELLLERRASIDAADEKTGFTSLHHAVDRDQLAIVSFLLERRAPIHARTFEGKAPLHLLKARKKKSEPGSRLLLVQELLRHRADPDVRDTGKDKSTLLQFVAAQGDTELMDDLFVAGADPNQHDVFGASLMHHAAVAGHALVLARLLDARALPDEQSGRGSTPVHETAAAGHSAALSLLLERRARVGATSGSLQTLPLHHAARNGHALACEALLVHGAEADARDVADDAPLHGAVKGGHVESAQVLLDGRAAVDVRGAGSQTALHRAAIHGHVDMAALLLRHGASREAQDSAGWLPHGHVRGGGAGRGVGHSPETLSALERLLQ